MSLLPHIEINPSTPATSAIIWLHGLGADGHDFAPIVPELSLPANSGLRFIFPHAPSMPVTINGGYVMPAWYDILEMQIERKVDIAQLLNSAAEIGKFIDREVERGIPQKKIIMAGFSQGGAVAYQLALSGKYHLGGLMCLSTYLATAELIEKTALQNLSTNSDFPIFLGHGNFDPVVPEILGQQALKKLRKYGYQPEYKTYPIEHSVCLEEIRDIGRWLTETLKFG
jgi:phospholipase/carboxylesterase